MHVKYSTVKSDRPVATGFLDDELTYDTRFYRDFSELWLLDPLHSKSVTCSNCGSGTRCVFYCTSPGCHLGLCFECYDKRKHPRSTTINWPHWDHYQLLESGPHEEVIPHGPEIATNDQSYVVDPTIVVTILGLGVDKDAPGVAPSSAQQQKIELALFGEDHTLQCGAGFYPYWLNHTKISHQDTFREKVNEVAAQLSEVSARRLIIIIKGHNSPAGYLLSNTPYSPQQLHSTIIEPLMSRFRSSLDRGATSPVHVLLNSCGADPQIWDKEIVQVQPAATRYDLVIFTQPVLLSKQSAISVDYSRQMINALNHTNPLWNSAHALARSMTGTVASQIQPAVLMHGFPPSTQFAYLAALGLPSPTSAGSSTALTTLSPPGAMFPSSHQHLLSSEQLAAAASYNASSGPTMMSTSSSLQQHFHQTTNNLIFPPLPPGASSSVATPALPQWTPSKRNQEILTAVSGMTDAQLRDRRLSYATEFDFIASLNVLAASLSLMQRHSAPLWVFPAVGTPVQNFRRWAQVSGWTITRAEESGGRYYKWVGATAEQMGDVDV
jgi:hypothetical protein